MNNKIIHCSFLRRKIFMKKLKKIFFLITVLVLVYSLMSTYIYDSSANSVYTVSTSATIDDAVVYIDGDRQAKSTITINAQLLEDGNVFIGNVAYWEVLIFRVDGSGIPIHSGFQENVKVNGGGTSMTHQRDIYTPVEFLKGQNQKTQRLGYKVIAHLGENTIDSVGVIGSGIGYVQDNDNLVGGGVGYLEDNENLLGAEITQDLLELENVIGGQINYN
jgi:hypothetical protein